MRPEGSPRRLEARRRKAMKLLEEEQLSLNEVARQLQCHASSVMRWRNRIQEQGEEGFTAHSPPGRPAGLSPQQKKQLVELLLQGPQAMGYRTDIWTTRRVADVVKKKFRVNYHPDHIGRLLHALGWSHQKPQRRAIERDEQAIARWKNSVWPWVKKTSHGWLPTSFF